MDDSSWINEEFLQPKYEFSIGTNVLADWFRNELQSSTKRINMDTLFINALTLLRNITSGNKLRASEVVARFEDELPLFIDVVQTYLLNTCFRNSSVAIYFPEYLLPEEHSRIATKDLVEIEAMKLLRKQMSNGFVIYNNKQGQSNQTCTVYLYKFTPVTKFDATYQRTFTKLLNYYKNEKCACQDVCMISHIPIDWHIVHLLTYKKRFRILESFTGRLVAFQELGQKVFKTTIVPFIPETHFLLGDKYLVKPILVRKAKKEFLELAEKKKFYAKTRNGIVDELRRNKYLPFQNLKIQGA